MSIWGLMRPLYDVTEASVPRYVMPLPAPRAIGRRWFERSRWGLLVCLCKYQSKESSPREGMPASLLTQPLGLILVVFLSFYPWRSTPDSSSHKTSRLPSPTSLRHVGQHAAIF